jgi:hypothetical protein
MYGENLATLQKNISSLLSQFNQNTTTYDASVVAGYKAITDATVKTILNSNVGQIELLFMNSDLNGDIGVTAALQHPYSHGRIYIKTSNPLDYPIIDPNYLAMPAGTSVYFSKRDMSMRIYH